MNVSVSDCRRILGAAAATLSDSQVEKLREQLYQLAAVVIESYASLPRGGRFEKVLETLSDEDHAAVEERAAILEFDAKLSRDQAERLALTSRLQRPQ